MRSLTLVRVLFSGCVVLGLGACADSTILQSGDIGNGLKLGDEGMIYYLPKTVVTLTIAAKGQRTTPEGGSPENLFNRVEIEKIETTEIADTSHGYSLHYDASALSTDRVCMAVNPSGLLQSVEAAADDKTGDIIVSVAKLFGRLAGASAFTTKAPPAVEPDVTLRTLKLTVDPLDPSHRSQVASAIKKAFKDLRGFNERAKNVRLGVEGAEALLPGQHAEDLCPVNSVCYRTKTKVRLTLADNGDNAPTSSEYVDVVNRRVVGHVDVTRALMVEKITKIGFDDGVLKSVRIKKPSEGLAVAKLPLTVLDAVMTSALAAPGQFVGNFSGLPPQEAANLIKQSAENSANIVKLENDLKTIREADLTPNDTAIEGDIFKLECSQPGKGNQGVVANAGSGS